MKFTAPVVLLCLSMVIVAHAKPDLRLKQVEDIDEPELKASGFLILDDDTDGSDRVVGMVSHYHSSPGHQLFGRRFGPFSSNDDDGSGDDSDDDMPFMMNSKGHHHGHKHHKYNGNNNKMHEMHDRVERHIEVIDSLKSELLASIHCPRMRQKILNELLRQSIELEDDVDPLQFIIESNSNNNIRLMVEEDDDDDGSISIYDIILGADEETWIPYHMRHSNYESWMDLDEEESEFERPSWNIDWSIWDDGYGVNWAFLSFLALTGACALVWSALLVQCCLYCSQYDDDDDDVDQFYTSSSDKQQPLMEKKNNKEVVMRAADYIPVGVDQKHVMVGYMPLNE